MEVLQRHLHLSQRLVHQYFIFILKTFFKPHFLTHSFQGGIEQPIDNTPIDYSSPPSVASDNIGDTTVQSHSQSVPAPDSATSPLPQTASPPTSPNSSSQPPPPEETKVETIPATVVTAAHAHPTIESLSSASTSGAADSTQTAPAPYVGADDVPLMRATFTEEANGSYSIVGVWGMTSGAHDTEGHTSPFELRCILPPPAVDASQSRYSGVYSGFFMLMQGEGKAPLKVDEKKVHLTFISNTAGGFNIQGTGKNRFGQFTMHGSMSSNNVELFRAYPTKQDKPKSEGRKKTPKTASPTPISVTLPSSSDPAKVSGSGSPSGLGGKSIQQLSISIQKPVEDSDAMSPGRAKRATAGDWKSKADIAANREHTGPAPRKGKGKEHASSLSAESNEVSNDLSKPGRVRRLPSHLQEIPDDKPVRLNEHLRKCLAILRELSKNPSAHWFAHPVDWRFFGLLDYPKVIKEPMDFSTIKSRIESGEITTPEEFKKDVLLTLRNAIIYNSKRDNIVNIAAREIQALFEEKYHTQVESVINAAAEKQAEEAEKLAAAAAAAAQTKPTAGRGRKPGSGSGSTKGKKMAKVGDEVKPKPGQQAVGGMVPQARFNALQQQMEMMQAQLETLKRQTSITDLNVQAQIQSTSSGGGGGGGSRKIKNDVKPLTSGEKNMLKQGISTLPPEKLPRVLDIIREREGSVGGGEEEVEIDLDTLDPPTLHLLQRYVKQCAPRKRKKPTPSNHVAAEQPKVQTHPSNILPDLDVDLGILEDDAFGMDIVDPNKRGRASFDPLSYDSYGLPEGLESDSDGA